MAIVLIGLKRKRLLLATVVGALVVIPVFLFFGAKWRPKFSEKSPVVKANVGKTRYYYNIDHEYFDPSQSYLERGCHLFQHGNSPPKECKELPVTNTPGWRAIMKVGQKYDQWDPPRVGLLYRNHFFEARTDATPTPNHVIEIASEPKGLLVISKNGGFVSPDVVSLKVNQPRWYPRGGKLSAPPLKEDGILQSFELQVPPEQFLSGPSPILVTATFQDGSSDSDWDTISEREEDETPDEDTPLSPPYLAKVADVTVSFDPVKGLLEKLAGPLLTESIVTIYNGNIYVTDPGRSHMRQLTHHKGVTHLAPSPDRKLIAYLEERGTMSQPGALEHFSGKVLLKIIDSKTGVTKRSFSLLDGSSIAPEFDFFWDEESPKIYFSYNKADQEGNEEKFFAVGNLHHASRLMISAAEWDLLKQLNQLRAQKITEDEKSEVAEAVFDLFDSLNLIPATLYEEVYDAGAMDFFVSPDALKIAVAFHSEPCSYRKYQDPLIVYDTKDHSATVVEGLHFDELKWVDNDNLIFTGGILTRLDIKQTTIEPFLRKEWRLKDSQCYQEGLRVDSLCDQDLEFFERVPYFQNPCDA